ncbi:hypothetical protein P168DRAFT_329309 [Aspergillus campestris IBT 28561]|uniref:NAD dependent epimerase/dehydratase n=1 Tax=Aspergillus campestris (strain IBT 28561) TaxID=1392248 RepID=A0A2I1CXN9_ASPC2|nr:uncharacterized protein P168DRAFT_329309 [Aspergillus campestris IBT 28561]PKY02384.1 hypothetical protein P168DRAFT_329309 [Aspergillus campestris IBT 28561]
MEFLKEHLYALEAPSRTRSVPMQVLAVGPSRSGTGSLRAALLQLGYDHCYHGLDIVDHPEDDLGWHRLRLKRERGGSLTAADFDAVIGHCAGITDHVAAAFAPELIAAYPDAKVILNIRQDVDAWHQSVMEILDPLHQSWTFWFRSWFCAELFWMQQGFIRGNWNIFYRGSFEKNSRSALDEHRRRVRRLVHPDRLLEWDIHDGWEPLCRFLGKPVPQTPFPTLNKGLRYEQLFRNRIDHADRNINRCIAMVLMGMMVLWVVVL